MQYIIATLVHFFTDLNFLPRFVVGQRSFCFWIEYIWFEGGVRFRSGLELVQFKKYKVIGKSKNLVAKYLENTIFQKLCDFPFDLSVSPMLAVGDKRKKERQKYPVHNDMTITPTSRWLLQGLWRA